jgi:hypothetical protein
VLQDPNREELDYIAVHETVGEEPQRHCGEADKGRSARTELVGKAAREGHGYQRDHRQRADQRELRFRPAEFVDQLRREQAHRVVAERIAGRNADEGGEQGLPVGSKLAQVGHRLLSRSRALGLSALRVPQGQTPRCVNAHNLSLGNVPEPCFLSGKKS